MLQGHTRAIVPCGNPTPKKLPTGGGEWPTFRTARAQRTVRPLKRSEVNKPHTFHILFQRSTSHTHSTFCFRKAKTDTPSNLHHWSTQHKQ